jgi:hypothetical protein
MANLPEPFETSSEDFSAIVAFLEELISERKVRIKASPGSNISFRIDSALLNESAQKRGIETSLARKVLSEASTLATLILKGQSSGVFETLLNRLPAKEREHREEIRDALTAKLRAVETKLVGPRVKQKYTSSRASKHDVLVNVRWEVVERRYDKDEGEGARDLSAVVKVDLAARPEFDFFLFPFAFPDDLQRKSFIVDLDEDDLDELVETLEKAKSRLAKERG